MSNNDDTAITLCTEERQRCEVWTRVMGYHRPVTSFNPGKRSEHTERRHFIERPAAKAGQAGACDSVSVA